VEMLIVAAGARSDLGQHDAAVVTLQVPELQKNVKATWMARLRSAYSDALAAVGRTDEARDWLQRALDADVDGEAGIADRLAEQDGLVFDDLAEYALEDDEPDEPDGTGPDGDGPAAERSPDTDPVSDVERTDQPEPVAARQLPRDVEPEPEQHPEPEPEPQPVEAPAAPPAPSGSATTLAFLAPPAADDADSTDGERDGDSTDGGRP
jgi:hypothetical protein